MNHRRSQRPIPRETKPFRAMATPKAGFEQPKKLGAKAGIGIGILAALLVIGFIAGVFLIRGRRLPAKTKPTLTLDRLVIASPTDDSTSLPIATNTAENLNLATSTPLKPSHTPAPTNTSVPTNTFTPEPTPTETPEPSPTSSPTAVSYPYIIRNTSQVSHVIYFPNEQCEKSVFVVGQVLDYAEKDVIGYELRLTGIHGGKTLSETIETGSMPIFGPSGFGFILPNNVEAGDEVSIQLFDKAGKAISKKTIVEISGECDKNLRLIRFKQTGDL